MEVKMSSWFLRQTNATKKAEEKDFQVKSISLKSKLRKIATLIMCVVVFTMSAITSNAVEKDASNENQKSVHSNSIIYLTQDDISNKDIFTEQEIKEFQEKDSQFLGGVTYPILQKKRNNVRMSAITGQVWVKSYATYSKNKGVSVYTKLYVPWYYFANPKFTIMSGNVKTTVKSKSTTKTFTKTAKGTSTISKTVSTGVKGSAGAKGTVKVFGIASGYNIAAGAGAFTTSYSITIPKS
jgi:hypothetical protein